MNVNKNIVLIFLGGVYSLMGMDVAPLLLLESIKKSLPEELVPIIKNNMLPTRHWWYCDQIFSHSAQANSVKLNGDHFAVGLHDGRVCTFNANTGKEDAVFRCGKWVNSVDCGHNCLVIGADNGLYTTKINEKYKITPHESSVFSVSLEGDYVATGSFAGTARIFDIRLEKKLIDYRYKGQDKRIFSVDLEGDLLALGFADGNVRVINIKTGKRLISRKYNKCYEVVSVCLNRGYLVAGFNDGNVRIFDINACKKIASYKGYCSVRSVRLIDGYLAIGFCDGGVRIINTKTSQECTFYSDRPLYSLDFDGSRIAVGLHNKSRIFKKYTDYTLEQLQLKCAFTTWLLLEKPCKNILKLKNKDERVRWLLGDVAKKCNLDYNKECVEIWSTFPIGMQRAIRRTMMHRIEKYGKNITHNTKKREKK